MKLRVIVLMLWLFFINIKEKYAPFINPNIDIHLFSDFFLLCCIKDMCALVFASFKMCLFHFNHSFIILIFVFYCTHTFSFVSSFHHLIFFPDEMQLFSRATIHLRPDSSHF